MILFNSFFFFNLLSIRRLEWPDISRPISVSGNYNPFPGSHATHDVIHSSDDGDFGETHHSIFKVLCFLQRLHRLHPDMKALQLNKAVTALLRRSAATYSPPSLTSSPVISGAGQQTPHSSTSSTSVHYLNQRHIDEPKRTKPTCIFL